MPPPPFTAGAATGADQHSTTDATTIDFRALSRPHEDEEPAQRSNGHPDNTSALIYDTVNEDPDWRAPAGENTEGTISHTVTNTRMGLIHTGSPAERAPTEEDTGGSPATREDLRPSIMIGTPQGDPLSSYMYAAAQIDVIASITPAEEDTAAP